MDLYDDSPDETTLFDQCEETSLIGPDEEIKKVYSNELQQEEKKQKFAFPKSVFFIVGNEFCERFSYYGLKTVLALYLSQQLRLNEDNATSVYHAWSALCYFTPIIGAIIADSWLGRYKTIVAISMIYAIGNIVLSLAATPPVVPSLNGQTGLTAIGLFLIAFGTGGIKPCVSAFGGDQFKLPEQERQVTKFFAFFYFSINAGSLLSTLLTPILREDVKCFGGDCYTLAFGIPALLMLVAIVLFMVGSSLYKIVAPEGNVIGKVFSCIFHAIHLKCLTKSEPDHWLDLAEPRYGPALVQDVKTLLRVLVLFLPLPIFWALFDQQGSRWTFQATKMNGWIGSVKIKPDQMQVWNPLLILLLIPAFDMWVYPACSHFNFLRKPLQRMTCGGILACLAFVVSGVIQMKIENKPLPDVPRGNAVLVFLNPTSCSVELKSSLSEVFPTTLHPHQEFITSKILQNYPSGKNMTLGISSSCNQLEQTTYRNTLDLSTTDVNVFVVSSYKRKSSFVHFTSNLGHDEDQTAVRVVDASDSLRISTGSLLLKGRIKNVSISNFSFRKGVSISNHTFLESGSYDVILLRAYDDSSELVGSVNLEDNSDNIIYLNSSSTPKGQKITMQTFILDESDVHILWLLPQYILLTVGEIMFSITGLEFSFTQAPDSMKSVVQAAWLMTVAFGNLFVMAAVSIKLVNRQSIEFFVFALLMLLDMIIFRLLSRRYENQQKKEEAATHFRLMAQREEEERRQSETSM